MFSLFCVNCFIATRSIKRYYIKESKEIDNLIRRWSTLLCELPADAAVCERCWWIATESKDKLDAKPRFGHNNVCIVCGQSCLRKRHKIIQKETDEILVEEFRKAAYPRPVNQDSKICHPCRQRAHRLAYKPPPKSKRREPTDQPVKEDPDAVQEQFIKLADYIRAPEISNKCFVETCKIEEAEKASFFMRVSLLKQCNFFIPKSCLVCSKHKTEWDFMAQPMEEIHFFKSEHVADMLQLMSGKS